MTELRPCKKCGEIPAENLQYSGGAFVSYGCCEIRTRHYRSRKTAKQVWNNWQTGGLLHREEDSNEEATEEQNTAEENPT